MESSDAVVTGSVALFESTCEALDVPVGAQRLGAFLKLPHPQREAILSELVAEAENTEADPTNMKAPGTGSVGGVTGKGFKPGQSGNPGGKPKGLARYARELVGEDGRKLADYWLAVLNDETADTRVRLEASKLLADRGFGRPSQVIEFGTEDELALTLRELVERARANGRNDG